MIKEYGTGVSTPRLALGACGGHGVCATCRFELLGGSVTTGVHHEATEKEKDLRRIGRLKPNELLGCNCRHEGRVPAVVEFENDWVAL